MFHRSVLQVSTPKQCIFLYKQQCFKSMGKSGLGSKGDTSRPITNALHFSLQMHTCRTQGKHFRNTFFTVCPRYGILASYHADRLHISQIQYYIELLTLYGPESGNNGRTCRRAGAATDQAFPFIHRWRSLHSEFMLKICFPREKKSKQKQKDS